MDRVFKFTAVLALCFGISTVSSAQAKKVVAQVNNASITLDEFNAEYEKVEAESINPPPRDIFLEDLVRFEIGAQEAEKLKIEQDPVVKKEIRKLLYKWLLEKNLGKKVEAIQISEPEMKAFYKRNPEIKTSHILIQIRPGAPASDRNIARERAQKIYSEVRASKKKFEDLVGLYTDDLQTKGNGGDLGWQTRVTTLPEFYEAALKTPKGSIAPLVETKFGFHIIKVTDTRDYETANKRKIRFGVFEEKKKAIFDAYFKTLTPKYQVKKNAALLK
jgi:peptidyl-prolyl cis-trans isomerase C/peptidyl-prolyl cis-trans isomerase D